MCSYRSRKANSILLLAQDVLRKYERGWPWVGGEKSVQMLEASMDASLVIPSVLVFATPKHQRRNIFHHIYSDPCPAPVSKVPFGISVQFRKLCKLTPKTVR